MMVRNDLAYLEEVIERKNERIAELEAELDRAANEIHRLGMKCSQQEDSMAELEAEVERLREVYRCAEGLCRGEDWNGGTAALYYRKPLREAVEKVKALQGVSDERKHNDDGKG